MPRSLPINLSVLPNADLEACNTAHLVLNAYTTLMTYQHNEKMAFDAGVRVWSERNPKASPEDGEAAVAQIVCHKP